MVKKKRVGRSENFFFCKIFLFLVLNFDVSKAFFFRFLLEFLCFVHNEFNDACKVVSSSTGGSVKLLGLLTYIIPFSM
jgi:hypothetical protein